MATHDTDNAVFNDKLHIIERSDPVGADFMNGLLKQLIWNDVALMRAAGQFAGSKNEQAKFLLNLHKNGKKYGVRFDAFSINPSPTGTLILDSTGMVAEPSTNTYRGQNDFEGESIFYGLPVNGSVTSDGDFTVTKIFGVDSDFSLTEADVWILFLPQFCKITIDANGETDIFSDTWYDGFWPEAAAIKTDGSLRDFIPIAKYIASKVNGVEMSVSGGIATQHSHASSITSFKSKGTQYCGQTMQDWEHMRNLFICSFGTRNFQSKMKGCTSYYLQYPATVVESDVERIIISKAQAANLVVGSAVSIGNATALNSGGTAGNIDRGQAGMHAKANRVRITKIEEYDANNSAVYVDNGGVTFSTGVNVVSGIDCPTYLSTMQWRTGGCNDVLGSCGSPYNNQSAKEPCLLYGVEMFLGYWEPCGNTIVVTENHKLVPYICYDCTELSTSGKTSDYTKVNIAIPNCNASWKYASEMGFDPDNPGVRLATGNEATSTTGYADGLYTEDLESLADGQQREVLLAGGLNYGELVGLWNAGLNNSLSYSGWGYAARLSATGRSGQEAA